MLQTMTLKQIPLDEISFENQVFRISEDLGSIPLLRSIREAGQLNPLILLDLKPLKAIVCGFRRVHALKQLEKREALARILCPEDCGQSQAFLLALWDNLSHRPFSPLEKARALFKLKNTCGIPDEELVGSFLPALGLPPNANVLRSHLLLNELHPDLRRCLAEGMLTQSSVEFLAEKSTQVQAGIAKAMNGFRWSAALQKKVLNLLDDLHASYGGEFDAPLKGSRVTAILEDAGLSFFQKGEKVYDALYRLRNPRLSQAEDRFAANRKKLGLPGSIEIRPHPYFEEQGLRIAFQAPSLQHCRRLAAALNAAAQSPEMEHLFDLD